MAEQNINAKIDTYIDRYEGGSSFSGSTQLFLNRRLRDSSFYGIFLQFDFPNFVNKEIVSATLRLYNTKKTRKTTAGVAQYNIPGSIAGLTANTFFGSYVDSDIAWSPTEIAPSATVESNAEWLEWDVTSILKNNINKSNVVLAVYDVGDVLNDQGAWKFTSSEGGKTPYINVVYNNAVPSLPTILYPDGDVIEKGSPVIFQWKHNSIYDSGQTKFEMGWRLQGESTWNAVTQSTSTQTYTVDSAVLPLGIIEWRIQTFNANDAASGYAYGNFELTGKPASPIITGMKNDAITKITWKCNEAENAVFNIRILQDGKVIHDSGEMAGGISDEYIPNMMLANGEYVVRMRIGSIYGVWSDESAATYRISASIPAVPDIILSPAKTGVTISTNSTAPVKYVYRAEADGEFVAIARFTGSTYTDYTIRSDTLYRYYVRAYNGGYSNSAEAVMRIHYTGTLLSELSRPKEFIMIVKSTEDWYVDLSRKIINESELIQYSGRPYRVKEAGIHKEETLDVTFYVPNKEIEKMIQMYDLNGMYLIRNHELCWCCEITGLEYGNALFNRGKNVKLAFSRVDHDMGVRFDG